MGSFHDSQDHIHKYYYTSVQQSVKMADSGKHLTSSKDQQLTYNFPETFGIAVASLIFNILQVLLQFLSFLSILYYSHCLTRHRKADTDEETKCELP